MTANDLRVILDNTTDPKLRAARATAISIDDAKPRAKRGTVKAQTVADRTRRTAEVCKLLGVAELPLGVWPKPTPGSPKNNYECAMADDLAMKQLIGDIKAWAYQPIMLDIGGCSYTADFWHRDNAGKIIVTEIKGFRREASIVRFKVARKHYEQFTFKMFTRKGGKWIEVEILRR